MANILVRDLDKGVVNRIKTMAKSHGRSLQGEVKAILTESVSYLTNEAITISQEWHKTFKGKILSDSAILIREDRDR